MTFSGAVTKAARITGLDVEADHAGGKYVLRADTGKAIVEVGRRSPKDALDAFLVANLGRIRSERLWETQGRCETCSRAGRPMHLHHKKHRSQGRDDRPENLELDCVDCHNAAHAAEGGKT